ncbi:hypothetical protein [Myxacorys almedinensis]|uniref:Uncharacterized protein n=1 Tax=Myxacorys almedinensis A TaxID=2690445 RepID=A0A8J7Z3X1_9CYAN|nr:hypothetical protein [Myxacorys almedinensis]NDJ17663.1 hypothetical protein [Myxacorys almedinensis A]
MAIDARLKKLSPAIFLFVITLFYSGLLVRLNYLRSPLWQDEVFFWKTSLQFSHSLIPNLNQLRNYEELNTPLPFIVFGALEYLFKDGVFLGRLFNFLLSLIMICMIGFSTRKRGIDPPLAACGLLLSPYYLWLSGHIYTDILASFFVFLGFWFYTQNRLIFSSVAFVLAIASRQYMVAFPVAIAMFELFALLKPMVQKNCFKLRDVMHIRWVAPSIAAASIGVWFWLFNGLAPAPAFSTRLAPDVQRNLWALTPNSGLFFLAVVGLCFVLPEVIFFPRRSLPQRLLRWQKPYLYIAIGLLLLFLVFPPALKASGILIKIANVLPAYPLKIALFYGLALCTCLRFARINLAFWILLCNTLLMMKAYPWDRYALPLIVVFWYLRAIGVLDKVERDPQPVTTAPQIE